MIKSFSHGHLIEFRNNKWHYQNGELVGEENKPCKNCNKYPNEKGYDNCIASLIKALNDSGIETVASCCGHGKSGNIALRDGRELIIAKDYKTARLYEKLIRKQNGK